MAKEAEAGAEDAAEARAKFDRAKAAVARLLLERGADVNVREAKGHQVSCDWLQLRSRDPELTSDWSQDVAEEDQAADGGCAAGEARQGPGGGRGGRAGRPAQVPQPGRGPAVAPRPARTLLRQPQHRRQRQAARPALGLLHWCSMLKTIPKKEVIKLVHLLFTVFTFYKF